MQTIYRTTNGRTNEVTFSVRCPNLRDLGPDVYRVDRLTLDITIGWNDMPTVVAWRAAAEHVIAVEPVFVEVLALSVPSLDELDGIDPFAGTDLTGPIPYVVTARGLAERVA